MNDPLPSRPSESEIDRMLAGQLRRTSPEFELRWRELRAELVTPRRRLGLPWRKWLLWPGLATAAAAAFTVAVYFRNPPPPAAGASAIRFEELIALNEMLQPGTPLLDSETRDALLNLPADSTL